MDAFPRERMATTFFKLPTILSITVILALVMILHTHIVFSQAIEDGEDYVVDNPFTNALVGKRFLARIRKGAHYDVSRNNICNGVSVNNGTRLLLCCKTHCCNVLGDHNNCGWCGHKCGFVELCCHGSCTNVTYNASNCGKCSNKCRSFSLSPYRPCFITAVAAAATPLSLLFVVPIFFFFLRPLPDLQLPSLLLDSHSKRALTPPSPLRSPYFLLPPSPFHICNSLIFFVDKISPLFLSSPGGQTTLKKGEDHTRL
uniref:Protein GRIM REAPER-like n=1 Tax=Nelumbo nucifera TaxID=4432 RepID=A0A822YNH1_NELNU|nr:TPA_asm: hypothetical protein HUJ06_011720 [Nelumbo nucifera]